MYIEDIMAINQCKQKNNRGNKVPWLSEKEHYKMASGLPRSVSESVRLRVSPSLSDTVATPGGRASEKTHIWGLACQGDVPFTRRRLG